MRWFISIRYLLSHLRQSLVCVAGVTISVMMFITMDSMMQGFTDKFIIETVESSGHITIYDGIGDDTETEFYWGLKSAAFENVTRDEKAMGDGAYLFDPQGDLRMSQTYPCREACGDPNRGNIAIGAKFRGREAVQLTNTGPVPIDLEPYKLVSKPYSYAFAPNSIVQPGETMRVRLWEADEDDRPLTRYWATNGPILNNGGDKVELRRFDDVLVTCTAWGSRSC